MRIVLPRVKDLGWKDEGAHLNKYLRGVVLRSAVFHNNTESVNTAKKMFNSWMESNTTYVLFTNSLGITLTLSIGKF